MSALIVLIPAQPDGAEFDYALTRDGRSVERHGTAQVSVLPPVTRAGMEVVALVPVSRLSWHRVELPKGMTARSPRLRAVLEGLLEDRLLDEPDALHFAVQPQARVDGPIWVATCDRAWLRSALQVLEAAGRPVSRIVPEFTPQEVPALHATGDADDPTLVVAGPDGVAALPLATTALPLLPQLPEGTLLTAEPAVAGLAEQVLQHPPVLQPAAERYVQAAQSDWDLAQFDLSSSGGTRAMKKLATTWSDIVSAPEWRPARWGAVLLVLLNLVALNAYAWRERSALEGKREGIRRALTTTFPQVKVVVDAPVQMEREVAALRQAAGGTSGRDLETMLAALAVALPPQRAVAGFDYANGELRARGMALSSDETREVAAALKGQGYNATANGDTLVVVAEGQP